MPKKKNVRRRRLIGRNEKCVCGSGIKFKRCCLKQMDRTPMEYNKPQYIDFGDDPIRWVICDQTGTKLFADKQGRVLVFTDKDVAKKIATLEIFADQAPNEINVAGVGEKKWQTLQEKIPFLEVSNLELGTALVHERIEYQKAQMENQPAESSLSAE